MSNQNIFFDSLMNVNFPTPDGLTKTSLLGATSRMPLKERFNVYRNNVFHSLIEALKAAFPLVEKTVGTAEFKILAHSFIKEHLPSNPVLYTYGHHLPDLLEQYATVTSWLFARFGAFRDFNICGLRCARPSTLSCTKTGGIDGDRNQQIVPRSCTMCSPSGLAMADTYVMGIFER